MTRSQALLTILRVGFLSIIGVGLSCLSLSVHALTLAGIEVQSKKGEPLRAEISVSSATAKEWGQLTAAAPMSVDQAAPPTQSKTAERGSGMLNLNRLLEAPYKSAYLWAALTLLGVLAVWAGLRIQIRKTSNTLSTLMLSENIGKSAGTVSQSAKLAMPANIAALDLNLDLTPQANNKLGSVRSSASTETLQ
jgi:hypothetical protein